jgi:carboxyl-terminal processing protease
MKFRFLVASMILLLLISACGDDPATFEPPDVKALQLRTFEALWSTVNDNYVYEDFEGADWAAIHDEKLSQLDTQLSSGEFTAVMREMLDELPADTARLETRQERIEQALFDANSYQGIGAFVAYREQPEPRIILLSVMPNSPAEQAGLAAHDAILAIEGSPISAEIGLGAVDRIRGEAGTDVTLTVRTPDSEPRDVQVTRSNVDRRPSRLSWTLVSDGVGYLLFPPATYTQLNEDVAIALQQMNAQSELESLILDLRVVTAGNSWPADAMLPLFTDGAIGEFYNRTGSAEAEVDGIFDFANSQHLDLAVLVGPDTTGAAEVFAASLQDAADAIVVGSPTQGDLEGATPYFLPDGSRLIIATTSFRTRDGRELGLLGIEPDIHVSDDWDEVTLDDDNVLRSALEALLPAE